MLETEIEMRGFMPCVVFKAEEERTRFCSIARTADVASSNWKVLIRCATI